jgi:hypothetical protein
MTPLQEVFGQPLDKNPPGAEPVVIFTATCGLAGYQDSG